MLCNNKQKQLYKIMKLNDMVETITDGINFVIVINEEIFDQLTEEQKNIALVECLAGVSVSENEAVSLEKPDFSTYRGVLQKYGHEEIIVLHESVKSLFDKKKQEEDERKAANKGKRGRPKSE
ncbi:MAG: putative metallopeptidase [bacterium]